MNRPKVLMLSPDLPFPIRAGGQMRAASLCLPLAGCCDLHIACIAASIPTATRNWANSLGITMENFPAPASDGTPDWYRHAWSIATRNNLRYDRREQLFFNTVLDRLKPDMVWLETPYLLRYVLAWMDETPVVVDYWGTSEGARRLFVHSRGLKKVKEWLKWWIASGSERRYARLLHDLICVSELDAQYFRSIAPQCRIWPIPIGIQETPVPPRGNTYREESWTMIMTGDLSYEPNIDAARYFAERIFPRVREEVPEAVFCVVGRNPSQPILELKGTAGIEVVGFVPDLAKEIRRCTIYVLPMRLGSGIRSKLFDVFPLGKAIVTTSVGAEGLELKHGENCLIADGEADFARCCIQLLNDGAQRVKLGIEARRLATDVYHQGKIDAAVRELVATVTGR